MSAAKSEESAPADSAGQGHDDDVVDAEIVDDQK
jgi:hypothetical protein